MHWTWQTVSCPDCKQNRIADPNCSTFLPTVVRSSMQSSWTGSHRYAHVHIFCYLHLSSLTFWGNTMACFCAFRYPMKVFWMLRQFSSVPGKSQRCREMPAKHSTSAGKKKFNLKTEISSTSVSWFVLWGSHTPVSILQEGCGDCGSGWQV